MCRNTDCIETTSKITYICQKVVFLVIINQFLGVFREKTSFKLIPRNKKVSKSHVTQPKNTTENRTRQHYDLKCLDIKLALGLEGFHKFLLVDNILLSGKCEKLM